MAFSIGREKINQQLEVKPIGKVEEGFGPALTSATFNYLESSYLRCCFSHLVVTVILHLSLKWSIADCNQHVTLW